MVDFHAMARSSAAIAASLVLSLFSWPVFAQNGDDDGDPFASPGEETREKPRPTEVSPKKDDVAPDRSNLLPNNGFPVRKTEENPGGWVFQEWRGGAIGEGEIVEEGPNGESCFKISNNKPGGSAWTIGSVAVKPNTRYALSVSVRTRDVETEKGARAARFGVLPMRAYSESIKEDAEWQRSTVKFDTGKHSSISIFLALGDQKGAKGTAWFSAISLREQREAESEDSGPPTYRRPSLDDPVFLTEGLTLDRDQVLALAEDIAALIVACPEHPDISNPEFQAQALGIALRLDPRNRAAVVANGQLDQGQKLRPTGEHSDLYKYWSHMDKWAKWLHSPDATPDDKALGLYLGDLARRIRPGEGFAGEFTKAHPEDLAEAWARILPPPPPPPVQPETPEIAGNTTPEPDQASNPAPVGPGTADQNPDKERYKIPPTLPLNTASLFVPVQTGGSESRAALRKVTLSFRDYELHSYWDENGGEKKRRVPHSNRGPTEVSFKDDWQWNGLRNVWGGRAVPMLDDRYEGWPQRGTIDVDIPDYNGNSGSIAVLATAICFEAMARGLTLDPKVGAVGTWGEYGELRTHSHLPGIIIGYAKDWPEILIVGPDSRKALEPVAATGLVTPFLLTQIIEVSTFSEAVAIASGKPPPEMKASFDAYRAIMAVRTKMDAGSLAQNRHVLEKLREVASANPKHLSAALMLKASENQQPLDFKSSANILSRLFRSLEQLAENDLRWVSPDEGTQSIEIFNDRMREYKPRFDRGLERHVTRLDDCTRALAEAVRLRDRTTGTALNRVENARKQVIAFRQALDLALAAGR